jgi:hypothetical protein
MVTHVGPLVLVRISCLTFCAVCQTVPRLTRDMTFCACVYTVFGPDRTFGSVCGRPGTWPSCQIRCSKGQAQEERRRRRRRRRLFAKNFLECLERLRTTEQDLRTGVENQLMMKQPMMLSIPKILEIKIDLSDPGPSPCSKHSVLSKKGSRKATPPRLEAALI